MFIKKIFYFLNKIPFSLKTSILIFIIAGGMICIIILSQISIYALKNDFDILFEKRTKPIIQIETIKDIYKINIFDTLYDIQNKNLTLKQSKVVISLGQQLIKKNWLKYQTTNKSSKYKSSQISKSIKYIFGLKKHQTNVIVQINNIKTINTKMLEINVHINKIINYLKQDDFIRATKLINQIYFKINSINIYLTNLTTYDLDMAIIEKNETQKIFNSLVMILNISIIFVFLFSIILSMIIIHNFRVLHFDLKVAVKEKTKELLEINDYLQIKISKEVQQNRKKDLIMFQQARLASLGEMIANIAHQWRQPLGSLMMIIQGIQSKMQLKKLSEDYVNKKVEDALLLGNNMSETLDDFQNFFKPNKDKSVFNLKQCLEDSFELSKYFLEQEKIHISLNIIDDVEIYGFNNELSHVFLNFISNSKDALKNKTNKKVIEIIVKKTKDKVKINIFDNGGGIKEEALSHIFEPYYTTKYKSDGIGLGLYMSKQIIEKHMNGSITCKNIYYKINKGKSENCSLFIISIPYYQGHQ